MGRKRSENWFPPCGGRWQGWDGRCSLLLRTETAWSIPASSRRSRRRSIAPSGLLAALPAETATCAVIIPMLPMQRWIWRSRYGRKGMRWPARVFAWMRSNKHCTSSSKLWRNCVREQSLHRSHHCPAANHRSAGLNLPVESVSTGYWLESMADSAQPRSEEHTSELQSHRDLHSFPTRRSSDLPPLPCGESSLGWAESARGECLHWILVGEHGRFSPA